jgi:hypothetical protein
MHCCCLVEGRGSIHSLFNARFEACQVALASACTVELLFFGIIRHYCRKGHHARPWRVLRDLKCVVCDRNVGSERGLG